MSMRRLLAALIFHVALPAATAGEPVPEYDMKAAFLYNYALFTEWPEPVNGQFNLCILGMDPFGATLNAMDGKQIKGARLTILRISTPANAKTCHILYFGESERNNTQRIMTELGNFPVLTITDADNLSKSGIMISMQLMDKHLTFEVNNEAAHRARLTLSSKMLWLARKVY